MVGTVLGRKALLSSRWPTGSQHVAIALERSSRWLHSSTRVVGRDLSPALPQLRTLRAGNLEFCAPIRPSSFTMFSPLAIRSKKSGRTNFSTMSQSQSWWETPMSPATAVDSSQPPPNLEFHAMDVDKVAPEEDEKLLSRRVHILGMGSIGTLVASALKQLPNPPPLTLLMHRAEMYEEWKRGDRRVRMRNHKTEVTDEQSGYDVDLIHRDSDADQVTWKHIPFMPNMPQSREPENPRSEEEVLPSDETFIYTLIVTVKGPATMPALASIKHRVDQRTTILLMQNGLGQIDKLNKEVFTDPATRPTYMLGIISHGAHMAGNFTVVHAGFGSVALGIHRDPDKYPLPPQGQVVEVGKLSEEEKTKMYPSEEDLYSNLSSRYLLRTMTRSPILACAAFPYLDLFQLQLEKLVSNCVLNPLTALLNVPNGGMLDNQPLKHVQRLLLAEIALVLRSLPELKGLPNVRMRFAPNRLEALFQNVTKKTARNSSSMREDVRRVNTTEIDFINGYIVKRGEQLGIKCVLNYMIVQLIKSKTVLGKQSEVKYEPPLTQKLEAEMQKVSTKDGEERTVVLEDMSTSGERRR